MRSETIKWGGGEDNFALSVPLLEALQDRCGGDGVGAIYQRLITQSYSVNDITATLALGLEGGGTAKIEAVKRVRCLAEDHGLMVLLPTATAVLGGALMGWPDDDSQGEDGVETPKTS